MNRTKSDEVSKVVNQSDLHHSRIEALDGTAEAIRKIRKQRELTERVGEAGLAEVSEAVSCAEEAIFYLATAAAEVMMFRRFLLIMALRISILIFRLT